MPTVHAYVITIFNYVLYTCPNRVAIHRFMQHQLEQLLAPASTRACWWVSVLNMTYKFTRICDVDTTNILAQLTASERRPQTLGLYG